jgi:hypothetical protein
MGMPVVLNHVFAKRRFSKAELPRQDLGGRIVNDDADPNKTIHRAGVTDQVRFECCESQGLGGSARTKRLP